MNEPVAVISSTVAPPPFVHHGGLTVIRDPALRLEQTRGTVQSLLALGVKDIYLADNSGADWQHGMEQALEPAHVQVFKHHQYRNKGISEIYLLLAALPQIPPDRPIIKVSGRYQISRRLDLNLGEGDFVVREWPGPGLLTRCVSTVAYAVRNVAIFEQFLRETLRAAFGYQSRIVGPGSLLRILRNSLFPKRDTFPYDDPMGSIEHSAWCALHVLGSSRRVVESLGIEGVAGQGGDRYTQ